MSKSNISPHKEDLLKIAYNQQYLISSSYEEAISRPIDTVVNLTIYTYCEFKSQHLNHEEEICSICLCEFSASDSGQIVRLPKCSNHFFHKECIEHCHKYAHLKCPICGTIYGVMTGDMPTGRMRIIKYPSSVAVCQGYSNDVIEILYEFAGLTRNGISIPGTSRVAYLPSNNEGLEILRLLMISFERRLTFTVGTSVTTGRENQIVWNGIHHKTSLSGGAASFGYPDESYFFRVREELAAKGIY